MSFLVRRHPIRAHFYQFTTPHSLFRISPVCCACRWLSFSFPLPSTSSLPCVIHCDVLIDQACQRLLLDPKGLVAKDCLESMNGSVAMSGLENLGSIRGSEAFGSMLRHHLFFHFGQESALSVFREI